MTTEYLTLIVYLVILLAIGAVMGRFNRNLSDYVRGGAQGVWWLVGMSMLMSGISAFTFTGNASAAFDAGPSMLVIYLANICGYIAGGLVLGRWFRQTRAHTVPDIMRARYGSTVEQFNVYVGLILGPFGAAIQLWALSVFASSVFSLPLQGTIAVIGAVVIFYSTTGGRWAVMTTDFVQGIILIPITLLLCWLALVKVGGLGDFFGYFSDPRFASDFTFVKEAGQFADNKFALQWVIIIFAMQFFGQVGIHSTYPYLSAKDGREASKAAWLAMVLMAVGTFVWFLPPMVARFLYADEVMAMGVDNPANASYAYMAITLLPKGLLGIMIAAMFSATMSSMDTGLNSQSGAIMRNLVPRLRHVLGMQPLDDRRSLFWAKLATVGLGCLVISYSLALSSGGEIVLFDAYFTINSIVGLPLGLPLLAALYLKWLPKWSYFFIAGMSLIPSAWSIIEGRFYDNPWTIQDRSMWVLIFAASATLVCSLFYRRSSPAYKLKVDTFFTKMRTPVDYEKEIGPTRDFDQLRLMGNTCLAVAGLLCSLFFLVSEWWEVGSVLFLVGFVVAVGFLLRRGAVLEKRRTLALLAQTTETRQGGDS